MLPAHGEDRVRIGTLRLELSVAGHAARAGATRARVERAIAGELEQRGSQAVLLPRSADGIWFVRQLKLELDLDLGRSDRELGAAFFRQLGTVLDRRLGENGRADVRYFADQSAYLAEFLRERAAGSAWSAWYFAAFDGLRALPLASALRTALVASPELGLAALLALSAPERWRVLAALTPVEARRTLGGLVEHGGPGAAPALEVARAIGSLVARDAEASFALGETPWRLALAAYVEASRLGAGPQVAELAVAAASVALVFLDRSAAQASALRAALSRGDLRYVAREVSAELVELLLPLTTLDARTRSGLLDGTLAPAPPAALDERRFTLFGGAFLLLSSLASVPLARACQRWPEPASGGRDAAVRLLVLAACFGPQARLAAARDPVLRALAGVPAELGTLALEAWLTSIDGDLCLEATRIVAQVCGVAAVTSEEGAAQAAGAGRDRRLFGSKPELAGFFALVVQALLADFARRLPGFAQSSPEHLQKNFLGIRAALSVEPLRWVVELERPPLNVVLSMTGLARARHRPPWLGGVSVELFQGSLPYA